MSKLLIFLLNRPFFHRKSPIFPWKISSFSEIWIKKIDFFRNLDQKNRLFPKSWSKKIGFFGFFSWKFSKKWIFFMEIFKKVDFFHGNFQKSGFFWSRFQKKWIFFMIDLRDWFFNFLWNFSEKVDLIVSKQNRKKSWNL